MGHEWGHILGGYACGHCPAPSDKTCLHEGLPVQFGELFVARRLPANFMWRECGGADTGIYLDERSGLGSAQPCKERFIPYAHRSRFDWIECQPTWGAACQSDDDCAPYWICESPDGGPDKFCTDSDVPNGAAYSESEVFTRLLRIMADGPSVFLDDQYPQDIDILDRPIGRVTTTRIIHDANMEVNTGTTLEDWMHLVLDAARKHGKFSEVVDALGADGFFPSHSTDATIGLTVRDSAFHQICLSYFWPYGWVPVFSPRRYLYLAWKDEGHEDVYVSVVQKATSFTDHWITKSVDTFADARSGTGVTWVKGLPPEDDQSLMVTPGSGEAVYQVHGYGRY